MTLIDIQNTIQSWVAQQTGLTTIWGKQNAPRAAMPYCLLYILSINRVGLDELLPPDQNGIYEIKGQNYLNLNVSIFYKKDNATIDAISKLDDLRLSVNKQSVNDYFNANNLSFIRPLTNIVDLSEVIATGFEQRAMIDLQFLVATYITDTVELIETVLGKGTVNADKTINYEASNG
jgi:hypothetical protein